MTHKRSEAATIQNGEAAVGTLKGGSSTTLACLRAMMYAIVLMIVRREKSIPNRETPQSALEKDRVK